MRQRSSAIDRKNIDSFADGTFSRIGHLAPSRIARTIPSRFPMIRGLVRPLAMNPGPSGAGIETPGVAATVSLQDDAAGLPRLNVPRTFRGFRINLALRDPERVLDVSVFLFLGPERREDLVEGHNLV
jgi:hypothetical protein